MSVNIVSSLRFQLDIVNPEELLYSGQVMMVTAPTPMGDVGILPRHSPLLAKLQPGTVKIVLPDEFPQLIYVAGGILEVQAYRVTILADTAIRAKDLDETQALQVKREAEALLKSRAAGCDCAEAYARLHGALAQLRTLDRLRHIKL